MPMFFLSMFKVIKNIPPKVWLYLAIIGIYLASLYYVNGVGHDSGFAEAEKAYNKASQKLLEKDLSEINSSIARVLAKQQSDAEAIVALSQRVSEVRVSTNEYKELLNEAKNNENNNDSSPKCVLSPEYIRLFQSIYPAK